MTLDDLREQLKREFQLYLDYRASMMTGAVHTRPRPALNMRQCYEFNKKWLEAGQPTPKYRAVLERFIRAGDVYYHAKKHGLESAMLFKLSRP